MARIRKEIHWSNFQIRTQHPESVVIINSAKMSSDSVSMRMLSMMISTSLRGVFHTKRMPMTPRGVFSSLGRLINLGFFFFSAFPALFQKIDSEPKFFANAMLVSTFWNPYQREISAPSSPQMKNSKKLNRSHIFNVIGSSVIHPRLLNSNPNPYPKVDDPKEWRIHTHSPERYTHEHFPHQRGLELQNHHHQHTPPSRYTESNEPDDSDSEIHTLHSKELHREEIHTREEIQREEIVHREKLHAREEIHREEIQREEIVHREENLHRENLHARENIHTKYQGERTLGEEGENQGENGQNQGKQKQTPDHEPQRADVDHEPRRAGAYHQYHYRESIETPKKKEKIEIPQSASQSTTRKEKTEFQSPPIPPSLLPPSVFPPSVFPPSVFPSPALLPPPAPRPAPRAYSAPRSPSPLRDRVREEASTSSNRGKDSEERLIRNNNLHNYSSWLWSAHKKSLSPPPLPPPLPPSPPAKIYPPGPVRALLAAKVAQKMGMQSFRMQDLLEWKLSKESDGVDVLIDGAVEDPGAANNGQGSERQNGKSSESSEKDTNGKDSQIQNTEKSKQNSEKSEEKSKRSESPLVEKEALREHQKEKEALREHQKEKEALREQFKEAQRRLAEKAQAQRPSGTVFKGNDGSLKYRQGRF